MSTVEEDVELRDLVAQALEKNGCLGKVRAQLRASIFLALDEDIKLSKTQPLQNLRLQSYLETPEGRAMFALVREFLDFFNLQFTISVYEPESYFETIGQYADRQKIAKDLGLDNADEPTVPLLQQLLKIAQAKSKILDINLNLNSNISGSYVDESLNIDSSYKKTETYNTLSINDDTKNDNSSNNDSNHIPRENNQYFNTTFDLNSPTVNLSFLSKINTENEPVNKNVLKDVIREEDSFEDNNSIKEDSQAVKSSNQSLNSISNVGSTSHKNPNSLGEKNPMISYNSKQINIENERNGQLSKKIAKDDDTYEDTSSIAEDSEVVVNTNNLQVIEKPRNEVLLLNVSNSTIKSNENALSQIPTAKSELEKPKLSLQRPKTSLSSLSDLPPLSVNKSRVSNDILPSLYSKEFKTKSNLKELDKMFDMEAEYEEDFLYSNNQLPSNSQPLSLAETKIDLLDESVVVNKMDSEKLNILNKKDNKTSSKATPDVGRSTFRPSVLKTCSNLLKTGEQSTNGSMSEHSLSD